MMKRAPFCQSPFLHRLLVDASAVRFLPVSIPGFGQAVHTRFPLNYHPWHIGQTVTQLQAPVNNYPWLQSGQD